MQRREFTRLAFAGVVSAFAWTPAQAKGKCENRATKIKRVDVNDCCGLIIDVQESFLSKLDAHSRSQMVWGTKDFAHLLGKFRVPVIATLEKPIERNGALPS